jgi:hypothetical protein
MCGSRRETDCETGEICHRLTATPLGGFCRPRCTVGGRDCAEGLTCRYTTVIAAEGGSEVIEPACEPSAQVPLGFPRSLDLDCGADAVCADPAGGNRFGPGSGRAGNARQGGPWGEG